MVISKLDVLTSFATVAEDLNYCMPQVDNSGIIDIKDGRHPVIEKCSQQEALWLMTLIWTKMKTDYQ